MLANYLIGLREGMEAALVVAILVAYLVRAGHRHLLPQVWLGLGAAVTLSLGVGALLTYGPAGLSERAEETIAGVLSVLAVGLVTWMIFWMARTARHLKADLHARLDQAFDTGGWGVALVTFLAVGREGLETALFLWAAAGATAGTQPLLGAVLGLATATLLGWGVYRGAVAINLRTFFTWTGLFLVVIAGGVLAYGVHELQEAAVLPEGGLAFDVSAAVPPESWYGTLLKGVLNFSPTTTWLEVAAWVGYVVPTTWLFARTAWARGARPAQASGRDAARSVGVPASEDRAPEVPASEDPASEALPASTR
jgi:high-affinity iron transporter